MACQERPISFGCAYVLTLDGLLDLLVPALNVACDQDTDGVHGEEQNVGRSRGGQRSTAESSDGLGADVQQANGPDQVLQKIFSSALHD